MPKFITAQLNGEREGNKWLKAGRDKCRKLYKFQQECQQFPATVLPHPLRNDKSFLNGLRHQEGVRATVTVGEVFLTGSWSGWQCFGPWLEAMSSDRIMISSRHRRSLTVLPAYSSAKPDNSLTVRNFCVCHLVIHKLVFWEIIHHVHCYMPLSSSYTHFDIYFYPSHLLGDRAFLEMNRWIFDAYVFLFASTLIFFFQVVEAICTQAGVW